MANEYIIQECTKLIKANDMVGLISIYQRITHFNGNIATMDDIERIVDNDIVISVNNNYVFQKLFLNLCLYGTEEMFRFFHQIYISMEDLDPITFNQTLKYAKYSVMRNNPKQYKIFTDLFISGKRQSDGNAN